MTSRDDHGGDEVDLDSITSMEGLEGLEGLKTRNEILGAKLRSNMALRLALDLRSRAWTREEHEAFAHDMLASWGRYRRTMIVLIVIGAIMVATGLYAIWSDAQSQATREELYEMRRTMHSSCVARNAQRQSSIKLYEELASLAEINDPSSGEARALRNALLDMPSQVDCSAYVPPSP